MDENHYETQYFDTALGRMQTDSSYYNIMSRVAEASFFDKDDKNKRILDFGGGLGQNVARFPNSEVYDISAFAREFCSKRGMKTIASLDEVKDNTYDAILMSHSLEHLKNPFDTLVFLRRKLKANGKLIIIIPKESHTFTKLKYDHHMHFYCWNFRTINNLLKEAGYEVGKMQYLSGGFYNIFRPVAAVSFGLYRLLTVSFGWIGGRIYELEPNTFSFMPADALKVVAYKK